MDAYKLSIIVEIGTPDSNREGSTIQLFRSHYSLVSKAEDLASSMILVAIRYLTSTKSKALVERS